VYHQHGKLGNSMQQMKNQVLNQSIPIMVQQTKDTYPVAVFFQDLVVMIAFCYRITKDTCSFAITLFKYTAPFILKQGLETLS
jgi:hypothetical protein